jgi:hypothetical protein
MSGNVGGKGFIGVWELEGWTKIGRKMLMKDAITSLAVSYDGKWLALYVLFMISVGHIQLGFLFVTYSKLMLKNRNMVQWGCLWGCTSCRSEANEHSRASERRTIVIRCQFGILSKYQVRSFTTNYIPEEQHGLLFFSSSALFFPLF